MMTSETQTPAGKAGAANNRERTYEHMKSTPVPADNQPFQIFGTLPAHVEAALRASIKRFGVLVPVALDQHGRILDGHHRKRIAGELGVPCPSISFEVKDDDEAREVSRTLNADRRQLSEDERKAVAADLRAEGHSLRAIADALGVSKSQVDRDLSTVPRGTVPRQVVGLDGKKRPAQARQRPRSGSRTLDVSALAKILSEHPAMWVCPAPPGVDGAHILTPSAAHPGYAYVDEIVLTPPTEPEAHVPPCDGRDHENADPLGAYTNVARRPLRYDGLATFFPETRWIQGDHAAAALLLELVPERQSDIERLAA